MSTDLQKASFGKRIIAAIFDGILLCILAVGLATVLSTVLGYDGYAARYDEICQKYESKYNIEFQITSQEYEELSDQQKEDYNAAASELSADEDAIYVYNMQINLIMLVVTFSILISILILEFAVPLFLKNGQTLGKKIFSIALMHTEGIEITNIQLFARSVLGKFAIELMIPLSILIMIFFNLIGIVGIIFLGALLIAEIISMTATKTNSLLHDVLSGTVAVDMASQRIFKNREELLEHTKALHAEQSANAKY